MRIEQNVISVCKPKLHLHQEPQGFGNKVLNLRLNMKWTTSSYDFDLTFERKIGAANCFAY